MGCKKEKDITQTNNHLSFSRNALDYINLNQGKYFIYKDSATLNTDSVIVTKSNLENIFYPENTANFFTTPAHYAERFSLTLTKFTNIIGNTTLWLNASAEAVTFPLYYNSDTADVYLSGSETTSSSPVFFQSHTIQNALTVTVEGKTYANVTVTVFDCGLAINNSSYRFTIYYWAKGVGIIKRTLVTTGGIAKTATLLRNN